LAVDACGNPIELITTSGNINDIVVTSNLLEQLDLSNTKTVCADRDFDSDVFRELICSKRSQDNILYKKYRGHLNKNTNSYMKSVNN
jgi:transposase DDE domain